MASSDFGDTRTLLGYYPRPFGENGELGGLVLGGLVRGYFISRSCYSLGRAQHHRRYRVLVADMLVSLWRGSRVGRAVCLGYLVSAVAMFAYWYPLLTAMKVSRDFVMRHIWLATWWS